MQQIFGLIFVDFSVKQTGRQVFSACSRPLLFDFTNGFLFSCRLCCQTKLPQAFAEHCAGALIAENFSRIAVDPVLRGCDFFRCDL